MMTYTRAPRAARPVFVIEGKRPTDNALVNLYVEQYKDTYYTTWYVEQDVVYRHQYSGKNVKSLSEQITELRAGLMEIVEAGRGIPQ